MIYQVERKQYLLFLLIFIGSFLAGTVFMNMARGPLLTETGILNPASLERLRFLQVDNQGLFFYVLQKRGMMAAMLCLLSATFLSLTAVYSFIVLKGAMGGMLLTAAMMRYGMKGMLFIVVSLFPQQFLLIPAWGMLLEWCVMNRYRSKNHDIFYSSRRNMLLLLWAALVLLIGSVLECYVNPILISELLKIFFPIYSSS